MRIYPFVKRVADIVFALVLLIVLSPFLAVVALLVWIFLGSPVIFGQIRPGLGGKLFKIYKFRTMTNDVNEHGELLSDGDRLTAFGKILRSTSIDEFPELLNVVRGDMSLVGPRPLLVDYLERYTPNQSRRHDKRPGITGWAQVNGRNAIAWEQVFEYDLYYIDHMSLALDLKVLWMTLGKVIRRADISESGQATRTVFEGTKVDN